MFNKLLDLINKYLIGKGSLKDVESYLVANLQEILDSGDEKAIELTNQVDADLVEFGEGVIDEATLWRHLEIVLRIGETISVDYKIGKAQIAEKEIISHTASSTETIEIDEDLTPVKTLHLSHAFD